MLHLSWTVGQLFGTCGGTTFWGITSPLPIEVPVLMVENTVRGVVGFHYFTQWPSVCDNPFYSLLPTQKSSRSLLMAFYTSVIYLCQLPVALLLYLLRPHLTETRLTSDLLYSWGATWIPHPSAFPSWVLDYSTVWEYYIVWAMT